VNSPGSMRFLRGGCEFSKDEEKSPGLGLGLRVKSEVKFWAGVDGRVGFKVKG